MTIAVDLGRKANKQKDFLSVMICIQTVLHSESVPERVVKKLFMKKVSRRQQNSKKLPRVQIVKVSAFCAI